AGVYKLADSWIYGERHLFGNKPIRSTDDFKNALIRSPETDVPMVSWSALGAKPTTVPYSELYISLQQGVVDFGEVPLGVMEAESLYEPVSHISLTGHALSGQSPIINNNLWESLTDQQQQALTNALNDAGRSVLECTEKQDAEALEKFRKSPDLTV